MVSVSTARSLVNILRGGEGVRNERGKKKKKMKNEEEEEDREIMDVEMKNGENGMDDEEEEGNLNCCHGKESIAREMDILKQLRRMIQTEPDCVGVLTEQGLIPALFQKLVQVPENNQVFLLQVLASLGYLVQKSDERADIAVACGAFPSIVNTLALETTSEGVLLLGLQVITFLVENSETRLRTFRNSKGIELCIHVLQRGCVRSSLLNARVALLLSKMAEIFPEMISNICQQLLIHVKRRIVEIGKVCDHLANSKTEEYQQALSILEDSSITLSQGFGVLLDNHPSKIEESVVENFKGVFKDLMVYKDHLSGHLLETICWTWTYSLSVPLTDPSVLLDNDMVDLMLRIAVLSKRAENSLIQAFATMLSRMLHVLHDCDVRNRQQEIVNKLVKQILSICDSPLDSIHTTGNSLRALGILSKLSSGHSTLLRECNAFHVYITLLNHSSDLPTCVKAEVLQELGLVVETAPEIGCELSNSGIFSILNSIISRSYTSQELCNATRAVACFVEHNTPVGNNITDIALAHGCDETLINVLSAAKSDPIDQEVLLNTVGALGYMIKRQSTATGVMKEVHRRNAPKSARLQSLASMKLLDLLGHQDTEESLMWNALWALIYLMNGYNGNKCVKAVERANGLKTLTEIMTSNSHNQPLVCSAAKALYQLVSKGGINAKESLSLDIRSKLLTCTTRSRPINSSSSTDEDNIAMASIAANSSAIDDSSNVAQSEEGAAVDETAAAAAAAAASEPSQGTIELTIDPGNITNSSFNVLHNVKGEDLRTKGLKIQYASEHVEQVGIDAGGVRRDWLSRLSAELFDPKLNLVISGYHPKDSVQISPSPEFGGLSEKEQNKWYRLMGKVIGLSILYGDPLGVALVPSFCKLLLEEEPDFEDIKYVSKQYYTTLSLMKHLRETDADRFKDALLDLTFTVNSRECMMREAFEKDFPNSPMVQRASSSPHSTGSLSSPKASPRIRFNSIRTLSQLSKAMDQARTSQDRGLIRKLLLLQNTMLQNPKQFSASSCSSSLATASTDLPEPPALNDNEDSGSESSSSTGASTLFGGSLSCSSCSESPINRKRRLSVDTTVSVSSSTTTTTYSGDLKRHCSETPEPTQMKRMMSDLMDGGDMKHIRPENFDRYLELLTFKLLVENVSSQVAMVKQGFHEVIPRKIALRLLTPNELQNIVEGDRKINTDMWKKNTVYKGGDQDTKQVQWFWEYVGSLNMKDRQNLLLWATGWRSIGQNGFANRYFTIELTNVVTESENQRLPSVATCGFHLWLPKYSSKEQLAKKFALAMRETSFGNC